MNDNNYIKNDERAGTTEHDYTGELKLKHTVPLREQKHTVLLKRTNTRCHFTLKRRNSVQTLVNVFLCSVGRRIF